MLQVNPTQERRLERVARIATRHRRETVTPQEVLDWLLASDTALDLPEEFFHEGSPFQAEAEARWIRGERRRVNARLRALLDATGHRVKHSDADLTPHAC